MLLTTNNYNKNTLFHDSQQSVTAFAIYHGKRCAKFHRNLLWLQSVILLVCNIPLPHFLLHNALVIYNLLFFIYREIKEEPRFLSYPVPVPRVFDGAGARFERPQAHMCRLVIISTLRWQFRVTGKLGLIAAQQNGMYNIVTNRLKHLI